MKAINEKMNESNLKELNYELWVYLLHIFTDTSFAFKFDWQDGQEQELYWPHLFYLKYTQEKVYKLIVEDPDNACYLISQIWVVLCFRYDFGIEGIDIDSLLKFAVSKKGGVSVNENLTCYEKLARLLEYQEYIYQRKPEWKTQKFFYSIIFRSVA